MDELERETDGTISNECSYPHTHTLAVIEQRNIDPDLKCSQEFHFLSDVHVFVMHQMHIKPMKHLCKTIYFNHSQSLMHACIPFFYLCTPN